MHGLIYRDYFKAKVYPIRVPGLFGDGVVPSLGSLRSFFGNPVTGNNSGFEGLGFRVYRFLFDTSFASAEKVSGL